MTKEEFDNYRFSIKTEVEYFGEMVPVTEINFEKRWIGIESGQILKYTEINKIGERINMKKKLKYKVCEQCGKAKKSVCYRQNAYDQDVNNDPNSYWTVCDKCDEENRMDI